MIGPAARLHRRRGREHERRRRPTPPSRSSKSRPPSPTSSSSRPSPTSSCRPSAPAARPWPSLPVGREDIEGSCGAGLSARSRPASSPCSSRATSSGPWTWSGTRSGPKDEAWELFEALVVGRPVRPFLDAFRRPEAQGRPGGARPRSSSLLLLRPRHPPPRDSAATRRSSSTRTSRRGSARPSACDRRARDPGRPGRARCRRAPARRQPEQGLLATSFFSNFRELRHVRNRLSHIRDDGPDRPGPRRATWTCASGDLCLIESEFGGDLAVVVDETASCCHNPRPPPGRPDHPPGHARGRPASSTGCASGRPGPSTSACRGSPPATCP